MAANVTNKANTTAQDQELQQYRSVVGLINGSSASSIGKENKQYLETMFADETGEGDVGVKKGGMI